jgi:hypothetical protein
MQVALSESPLMQPENAGPNSAPRARIPPEKGAPENIQHTIETSHVGHVRSQHMYFSQSTYRLQDLGEDGSLLERV